MNKLGTTITTIALGGALLLGAGVTTAAAQPLPGDSAASPMLSSTSTAPATEVASSTTRADLLRTLPTLRQGSKGGEVLALQVGLRAHGARSLQSTGSFGSATVKAVKDFQRAHGVAVDGIVGPRTWNALVFSDPRGVFTFGNPQIRPGQLWSSARSDVGGYIWETLTLLHEYTNWVPKQPAFFSRYGGAQVAAIRELQRRSGISPSGIIGPSTTRVLIVLVALLQEFGD